MLPPFPVGRHSLQSSQPRLRVAYQGYRFTLIRYHVSFKVSEAVGQLVGNRYWSTGLSEFYSVSLLPLLFDSLEIWGSIAKWNYHSRQASGSPSSRGSQGQCREGQAE